MNASNSINITDVINERPISRYQTSVFFLCALAALMDGYDSVIMGITAPAIAASLGLDVKTFGPIFSASQLGFMIGAFLAGPLADRFGRKSLLIQSVVVFGLFALFTPMSTSYNHLIILRFLTGLGLGGASATFVSLSTEYAPARVRATIVALMWAMVPLGNVVGGLLSSAILPSHGWMIVYYVGGVIPICIAIVMVFLVPESLGFMVVRGVEKSKLSRIMRRIAPDLKPGPATTYTVTEERISGANISNLFTDGRALTTLCFWVVFFCCWLVLITLANWMVPILREAGIPISKAPLMLAANSGGAVIGALIIGRTMDKTNPYYVVISAFFVGAVSVSILGFAVTSAEMFAVFAFIEGFALGGVSTGLVALVAASYPTAIRSTGIGWAIAISRFGAFVGPVLAGFMLSGGWSLHAFFGSMGALVLVGMVFLIVLMLNVRQSKAAPAVVGSTV
jgi:MFS transporter, AAHS family, 4-hydroxybenzoate transporter